MGVDSRKDRRPMDPGERVPMLLWFLSPFFFYRVMVFPHASSLYHAAVVVVSGVEDSSTVPAAGTSGREGPFA